MMMMMMMMLMRVTMLALLAMCRVASLDDGNDGDSRRAEYLETVILDRFPHSHSTVRRCFGDIDCTPLRWQTRVGF
uniref:Putative secreted protein n=1 Tax=Anopheles darlingi TaxID=43151 RepID=A0A2M4D0R3_ANODA